ncbi:MAG: hypothetical protein AVDCRST_MAG72-1763, partial [uncultured Nocardioidaceae bacterium]
GRGAGSSGRCRLARRARGRTGSRGCLCCRGIGAGRGL